MAKRKIRNIDSNLGSNLAYFRKLVGLTQQQVADKLQINRTTYTKYETGVSEPNIEILRKIADILSVDVSLLLFDEVQEPRISDVKEEFDGVEMDYNVFRKRYEALTESEKEYIDDIIEGLIRKK